MNEVGLPKTELDTPALWVDLDRMASNITGVAKHFKTAGVAWRPHIKGIKIPAIAHQLLAAGAIGITCAKVSEAEVMVAAGIKDILIANQIVTSKKIERLLALNRQAEVKVTVDHPDNVITLGQAAQASGVELNLLVELDTGMNRTGVLPGQAVLELSRLVHQTRGLRYLGLMTWEGVPTDFANLAKKEETIRKAIELLLESVILCRQAGLPVTMVSGGGSGTYKVTPLFKRHDRNSGRRGDFLRYGLSKLGCNGRSRPFCPEYRHQSTHPGSNYF